MTNDVCSDHETYGSCGLLLVEKVVLSAMRARCK